MQMEEGAVRRRSLLFSPTNRKPLSDCSNNSSNINAALSSSSNAFNKCKSRNSISRRTPTPSLPLPGSVELDVSMPVSAFCSERHTLDERKNKKKAVSNVVSGRQIPKTSDSWNKSDGVESLDMLKAKPLTVPCRKKQRAVSCEKRISKEAQLQDFIKKQNTYFKEIDEFILSEEEVESVDELD